MLSLKKQKQDTASLIAEMKELGKEIQELDEKAKGFDAQLRDAEEDRRRIAPVRPDVHCTNA